MKSQISDQQNHEKQGLENTLKPDKILDFRKFKKINRKKTF